MSTLSDRVCLSDSMLNAQGPCPRLMLKTHQGHELTRLTPTSIHTTHHSARGTAALCGQKLELPLTLLQSAHLNRGVGAGVGPELLIQSEPTQLVPTRRCVCECRTWPLGVRPRLAARSPDALGTLVEPGHLQTYMPLTVEVAGPRPPDQVPFSRPCPHSQNLTGIN